MGAEAIRPNIEGIRSDKSVLPCARFRIPIESRNTSNRKKPGSVAIVGGGFIGIEMAEKICSGWVLTVTLIDLADQVLAPIDYDMAKRCSSPDGKQRRFILMLGNSRPFHYGFRQYLEACFKTAVNLSCRTC